MRALLLAATLALALPAQAGAALFTASHTGTLAADDEVQFVPLTLDGPAFVTLVSHSYAGGINAAGQAIPRGGFDIVLSIFDLAGNLLAANDDGGADVPTDALTASAFDSFLTLTLAPGDYTIAVSQFDNEALGPTLAAGFLRTGTFTAGFGCPDAQPMFNDVSGVPGCGRTAAWAFDVVAEIPEPASALLLAAGLLGLATTRRPQR
jgi:hypothetical protein